MRPETARGLALAASLVASVASGCATSSLRDDLGRIEALTATDLGRGVRAPAALGEPEEEVSAWLAEPLTVERAVAIGMARNRALRAELRELGVDRGRLLSASLLPNPVAELDLREPEDDAQPLQVELYLEVALTEALLTPMRTEAAARDLDAARIRVAGRVLETAYEIRRAFYAARAAEERWQIATRSLDAMAAARDAARMLFEAGNLPALDLATEVAAYEEARVAAAGLELERATRREALHRLLGLFGAETEWSIALDAEPVAEREDTGRDLEQIAVESSLELAALRMRSRALGTRVDLSRLEGWLPDVSVDVHAEEDGTSWEVGGGVSLSLPIFDHGEGVTMAYEAELDGLVERYEGTAIDVRSSVRDARNRLEAARLRARHYETVLVPAWAAVVEETRLQYDAMQLGIFELVAALRARLSAELDLASARADYFTARAALEALLAGARVGAAESADGGTELDAGAAPAGGH